MIINFSKEARIIINIGRSRAGKLSLSRRLSNAIIAIHVGFEHIKTTGSCHQWITKSTRFKIKLDDAKKIEIYK
jgi:hypothetical protein